MMNIRQTIAKDLVEDVNNLLSKYLLNLENSNAPKVSKSLSDLISGKELSAAAQDRLKAAGSVALGAAGGLLTFYGVIAGGLDVNALGHLANKTEFAISTISGIAAVVTAMNLHDSAKNNLLDAEFNKLPEPIKTLLMVDEPDNPEAIVEALSQMSTENFGIVENLAWIGANRKEIVEGSKPMKPDYKPTGAEIGATSPKPKLG